MNATNQNASRVISDWIEQDKPYFPFGFWALVRATRKLHWSRKTKAFFGLSGDEPTPTFEEFVSLVHPEDCAQIFRFAEQEVWEQVIRITDAKGNERVLRTSRFDVSTDQPPDYILGIVYDITDEQWRLNQLRAGYDYFRTLVEDMPAMFCRFLPDGALTYVNAGYARAFSRHPNQLIGANWLNFLPESDRHLAEAKIAALSPASPAQTYEHWVDGPTGRRWHLWTDRGFFDENDKLTEVQSVGLDLTEQRNAERQIFHLSKVCALGDLAAGTAHELFQPLGALLLAAENALSDIERKVENKETLRRRLKIICEQVARLTTLVSRMKALGRPVDESVKSFRLNEVIDSAVELIQHTAQREGITIVRHCPDVTLKVSGIPDLLINVLLNLLANSRDAILDRREREAMTSSPVILIDAGRNDGDSMAIVTIRDCGGGVDETLFPRLFEPFFTTKVRQGGSGLGLSISLSALRKMGGTIEARNEGDGLTVEIRLPLAGPASALTRPAAKSPNRNAVDLSPPIHPSDPATS